VARGDAASVADHVRAIEEVSPEAAIAYRALGRLTADRAVGAGLLKARDAEALLEVLGEGRGR
jgi:predicted short-subunit dehydrogenase-like oxidoreductase (DUF2520 family)